MLKRLIDLLATKEVSAEEKAIILNMQRLGDIRIRIADPEDPRQKGEYRFQETENEFIEQTGRSNYLTEFPAEDFLEALETCDYIITVLAA